MIIYRQLQSHEWDKLVTYLAGISPGYIPPSPETAIAAVAEDEDGNIVGALIQQLVWHREPLALSNPSIRFDRLCDTLNEAFAGYPGTVYYSFADSDIVARMAKAVGMEEWGVKIFKGGN